MKIYIVHLGKEELYSLCKTLTRECEVYSANLKNTHDRVQEICADVIHRVCCVREVGEGLDCLHMLPFVHFCSNNLW